MENYEKLKKVIQEATNSVGKEIVNITPKQLRDMSGFILWEKYIIDAPITLTDIFIAVFKKIKIKDRVIGLSSLVYYGILSKILESWNLIDNNLDNQSDKCKEFLIKLLVK